MICNFLKWDGRYYSKLKRDLFQQSYKSKFNDYVILYIKLCSLIIIIGCFTQNDNNFKIKLNKVNLFILSFYVQKC